MTAAEAVTGVIFDIQHSSFVDGPGMRSTVFLKGCPLRCCWCHNPEAIRPVPELVQHRGGTEAEWCGREVTVGAVLEEILGEKDYYAATGGGLTISGGEPLAQGAFTTALLHEAKARGLHTCLDTSGQGARETLAGLVADVDVVLFDYKATGAAKHRELTGMGPEVILRNLDFLCERGTAVILRCPMVPGLNDGPEHFTAIAELSRRESIRAVEILPYHHWGRGKAMPLWCPEWGLKQDSATVEDRTRWEAQLSQSGCLHATIR